MFPFPHTESNWNKPNVSSAVRVCQNHSQTRGRILIHAMKSCSTWVNFSASCCFQFASADLQTSISSVGAARVCFLQPRQIMVKCKQFGILLRQNRQSQFIELSSKTKQLCKLKNMLIPCIAFSQQYHAHIFHHLLHNRPLENVLFFLRLMWTCQKAVEL